MPHTHPQPPRDDPARAHVAAAEALRSVRQLKAMAAVVVVLFCVVLLRDANAPIGAEAHAQTRGAQPAMVNPADQRNEMVAQLERINSQLDAIRRQLDGGKPIKVDVASMPREDRAASR